jgi:raffinose/stachyose/melibiose transport system substrate-binding protein
MRRIMFAVLVFLLLASVTLLAGGTQEPAGKAAPRTGRIWIWGEDEAPGLNKFVQKVGDLYSEKKDPSIKWEVTNLDIDEIYTGFYAAEEAKNAPELHTLWGGILGFEPGWAGHLAPISDYVSEKTLSHVLPPLRHDGYWNGKDWLIPLYVNPWPLMINKTVWKAAGVNPDALPTSWAGFLEAIAKIKASGSTPWCVGIKDGFYGTWFPAILQHQLYNDAGDYLKAVVGIERLDRAPHDRRWYMVQELRDAGAFNPDVNSLSLAEGQDLFLQGNVGIIHASGNAYMAMIAKQMGEANTAIWIPPVDSKAKSAGTMPLSSQPVGIPATAKYKQDAGKFLEYFYSKEIQNLMYADISVFSGSNELERASMKTDLDRALYDLAQKKPGMTYPWLHPGAIEEASYAITQKLLAGDIDGAQAAKEYEQAAEKWRAENPEELKNVKIWATEKMPFMK